VYGIRSHGIEIVVREVYDVSGAGGNSIRQAGTFARGGIVRGRHFVNTRIAVYKKRPVSTPFLSAEAMIL
jgi:hypothetical protein